MMEKQLWHPVMASSPLRGEPLACTLLGQPLVLWREPPHNGVAGRLHAWADVCPHRGARLSLGRVLTHLHGARLECPYHGWQFGGDAACASSGARAGRCLHVPAAPDFVPPASHRAGVFEAQERYGLVWVRLQIPEPGAAHSGLSGVPFFGPGLDPDWRQVLCGPYAVQTSAPRLVENFLDLSHFGFVHEGWLGERTHAQVNTGRVQELEHGLVADDCRAWQPRGYASAHASGDDGSWVGYRYDVPHPFAGVLRKQAMADNPVHNAIALFIRPDSDNSCTAWFAVATQGDPSTDETLRSFQDAVFEQDRPVIESQSPRQLPIGRNAPSSEVHGPADRMSGAYRRYLARLGVALGVC